MIARALKANINAQGLVAAKLKNEIHQQTKREKTAARMAAWNKSIFSARATYPTATTPPPRLHSHDSTAMIPQ